MAISVFFFNSVHKESNEHPRTAQYNCQLINYVWSNCTLTGTNVS